MEHYDERLGRWSYYFAALLLGHKAEFVIAGKNGYTFASISLLEAHTDTDLKRKNKRIPNLRERVTDSEPAHAA